MLKHHIRYTIKRWWPMILIFGIMMITIYGIYAMAAPTYYTIREMGNGYTNNTKSVTFVMPTLALLIPALLASLVMSLFVFTYRTRKQSVDVFYQAAYGPTTIKRVRVLVGLGILLIAVTAAFVTGFLIYLFRFLGTPEVFNGGSWTRYRINVHFGYFFLGYLLVILTVSAQYFINCFLVNLGNYFLDQLMLLIFGNVVLCFFVSVPAVYILLRVVASGSSIDLDTLCLLVYGIGPIGPVALECTGLGPLTSDLTIQGGNQLIAANALVATIIQLAAGTALAIITLNTKDPSGEYADVAGARNKAIALIPHGAGLIIGISMSMTGYLGISPSLVFLPVFLYLLYGAAYYALLSLWRHSFKRTKFDLICYLSVAAVVLAFLIAAPVTYVR